MGHYEDSFFEIYYKVKEKKLESVFNEQIEKMKHQDKHKFKSVKDKLEYAYTRITSSNYENEKSTGGIR